MRALLDYDPEKDPCVPCREVALTFRRGDVLQVLSKEDDTWWQARHHGDHDSWAGLIPSEQLHQRPVHKLLFPLFFDWFKTSDHWEDERN